MISELDSFVPKHSTLLIVDSTDPYERGSLYASSVLTKWNISETGGPKLSLRNLLNRQSSTNSYHHSASHSASHSKTQTPRHGSFTSFDGFFQQHEQA